MIKIETHSPLIFRYDNAIDLDLCDQITEYIKIKSEQNDVKIEQGRMPWHDSDEEHFISIKDDAVKNGLLEYKNKVNSLIKLLYNEENLYPHFTDIVLWREGREMPLHKDDGYDNDKHIYECRHYTAVTYCNDDYVGGRTYVTNSNGGFYYSQPKKGSLLIFTSDERCLHGVEKVTEGQRVAVSIWFTRDELKKEL